MIRAAFATAVSLAVVLGCAEPPPPVAQDLMDRVTTEVTGVSLGSRDAYVTVARVPNGFFDDTARPVLGRTFYQADFEGEPTVCIISRRLWEQLGAGESEAPLVVGEVSLSVIGVMPPDFDLPLGVDVWIPQ